MGGKAAVGSTRTGSEGEEEYPHHHDGEDQDDAQADPQEVNGKPPPFPYLNVGFFLLVLIMSDLAFPFFLVMLLAFLMIHTLASLGGTACEIYLDSAMVGLASICKPRAGLFPYVALTFSLFSSSPQWPV
jgi:hypothetical protein